MAKHLVLYEGSHVREGMANEYEPGQPIRNAKCLLDRRLFIGPARGKVTVFEGGESPVHRAEVFGADPRREGWVPEQVAGDLRVCYWSR
jgi:hypothetical protein